MFVANKDLCEELYSLSCWGDCTYWVTEYRGHAIGPIPRDYQNDRGGYTWLSPAYDTGYILHKLPGVRLETFSNTSSMALWRDRTGEITDKMVANGSVYKLEALGENPEDALCKLAIELFRAGILKPERTPDAQA